MNCRPSQALAFTASLMLAIGVPEPGHAQEPSQQQPPSVAQQQAPESLQAASPGAKPRQGAERDAELPVQALPDFTSLVRRYGDAVVNVNVVAGADRAARGAPQVPPNDPFYDFFRRFGIPDPRGRMPPVRGQGSGFIVSPDGYILTNAHVVQDASEVTVRLTDRREFSAKVVGVDPRTDVAVLKIEASSLPTVRLGDPGELEPGEWVIAIGSPFGFENSVTAGIVSATSRALGAEQSIVPFIQTDVAVNPGNSGGPLFNLEGEVVGVNSLIYSATGGYQGVSFAIPIDVALDVQRQLVKTGRVVRGRIGVTIQEVDAQLAQSFGLERPRGALVSAVEEGGPAAKAGLRPGDVILGVNSQPIETSTELPSVIASLRPGSEARLEIWRDRGMRRIEVPVAELEQPGLTAAAGGGPPGSSDTPQLGIAVRPLSAEERQQTGGKGGLLVVNVTDPAAGAGVQPGDVLLAVNDVQVSSVEELRKALQRAGDTVALLIQRGDGQLYLPVRIPSVSG